VRRASLWALVLLLIPCVVWAQATPVPVDAAWGDELAHTLSGSIAGGRSWLAFLAAWLGGLLTAFTPCVYPLIPITVRYFGGMQKTGRGRVLELALIYVLGMVLLYAVLGTIFAAFKLVFGSYLSSPYVGAGVALLCVAMGLSILGTFTLQLPSSLSTRLSQLGGKSAGGALLMGLVSGLIAAPCTGPVLAVILAVIATSGEIFYGFWLMTCFAVGLGAPFLLLAISAGNLQKVPTAGPWMELIKILLAAAMFVVAAYYLNIVAPGLSHRLFDVRFGGLAGLVLIVAGLGAGALFMNLQGRKAEKVLKAGTVILLTAGAAVAMFGGQVTSTDPGVPGVAWMTSHDKALARARAENRPMMLDFTAEWCLACKELEQKTYTDERVRAEATRFVAVKLDATEMTPEIEALFAKYGILGLPAVVFVDSAGLTMDTPRVTGFVPADHFLTLMRQVH
jgi:thioredoxin:protein disulfide reductase